MQDIVQKCTCGSALPFDGCCRPYLNGEVEAATPEALMRSRYTAFARGDFAYLKKTWHPDTVPDLTSDEPSNWVGLEIVETAIDDEGENGEVEFIAKLIVGDRLEVLHEVSDFEKVDGRWLYHSGEFKNEATKSKKISMKDLCPCGSGETFKHCHWSKG